jgi:hypothetical protein
MFVACEESIASATKLPRVGDRWFKHHQLPQTIYNRVFKMSFRISLELRDTPMSGLRMS